MPGKRANPDRPIIGITIFEREKPTYAEAVRTAGGDPVWIPLKNMSSPERTLDEVDGLLLTGGSDVEPGRYGEATRPEAHVEASPERDAKEFPLIEKALARGDFPVLGICRGMQALNIAMGGKLIQDLPNHRLMEEGKLLHEVFVPPGCRLTHLLGIGGFMKVNSRHHQGATLLEKAPGLLVSAFSLKDGIIEALDSPREKHRWVVGVQWHPENRDQLAAHHQRLFTRFIEAAKGQDA
jgi:putative glutamine amidotransferase